MIFNKFEIVLNYICNQIMKYNEYSLDQHKKIGYLIYGNNIVKNLDGPIYISKQNFYNFLADKDFDKKIIDDLLILWNFDKIKFIYFINSDNLESSFICNDWVNFRPILYLILKQINFKF